MLAFIDRPLEEHLAIRKIVEGRKGLVRGYFDRGVEILLPRDADSIDYIHDHLLRLGLSRYAFWSFPAFTDCPNDLMFSGGITYAEQWVY